MGKKTSVEEAQLLLQLYDLRREAEMRKARDWWMWQFAPRTADDFLKVAYAMGTPENNWMRQVASYWGLAASFVLQGVLSEELFLRPAFSGEMFFVLAKVYPFLPELREKLKCAEQAIDSRIQELRFAENSEHELRSLFDGLSIIRGLRRDRFDSPSRAM